MAREDRFLISPPKRLKENVVLIDGSELSVKEVRAGTIGCIMSWTSTHPIRGATVYGVQPVSRITEITGLTERSVRSFGKEVRERNTNDLLTFKEGRGRKGKVAAVEEEIL